LADNFWKKSTRALAALSGALLVAGSSPLPESKPATTTAAASAATPPARGMHLVYPSALTPTPGATPALSVPKSAVVSSTSATETIRERLKARGLSMLVASIIGMSLMTTYLTLREYGGRIFDAYNNTVDLLQERTRRLLAKGKKRINNPKPKTSASKAKSPLVDWKKSMARRNIKKTLPSVVPAALQNDFDPHSADHSLGAAPEGVALEPMMPVNASAESDAAPEAVETETASSEPGAQLQDVLSPKIEDTDATTGFNQSVSPWGATVLSAPLTTTGTATGRYQALLPDSIDYTSNAYQSVAPKVKIDPTAAAAAELIEPEGMTADLSGPTTSTFKNSNPNAQAPTDDELRAFALAFIERNTVKLFKEYELISHENGVSKIGVTSHGIQHGHVITMEPDRITLHEIQGEIDHVSDSLHTDVTLAAIRKFDGNVCVQKTVNGIAVEDVAAEQKVAKTALLFRDQGALHDSKGQVLKEVLINGKTPEQILGLAPVRPALTAQSAANDAAILSPRLNVA